MTGERARSQLAATRFRDLRWVDETGSTNEDLLEAARAGEPEGVVLVADSQTAGRGRLGRAWQAPPASSLLVSVLLRPPLSPQQAHLVATAVACSAAEACSEVGGVKPTLKWPNDLIVALRPGEPERGTKLGGILAESIIDGGRLAAVVVGIGLNVNWPATVPDDLRLIATALNHLGGETLDREELLVALLVQLDGWCSRLSSPEGLDTLRDTYRMDCSTIGSRVRIELADRSFEGVARDISADGHLLVERHDTGTTEEITTGDVVHLRPV